jgi:glycosyltransferase involved in cell wall biosynthesis
MKITILICVHSRTDNNDILLLKALNSLNKQLYSKFDVIIVFDECWDKTQNLIIDGNYMFTIKRLVKDKKSGLANAKNFGLSHIDSEWVCFLDADDLYMPDKILKQVEFVNNNEVDFLSTLSWNKYPNNDNYLFESCFKVGQYEKHDELVNVLKEKENVLTHGAMMIRKSCLDELDGYRDVRGMEDWDLWKRAIQKGYKFYQLQDRLYVWTMGTSVAR